jgi:hypothetical protein
MKRQRRKPVKLKLVKWSDTMDTATGLIRKRNMAWAGIRYQSCGGGFRVLKISGEHKPHSLKGA